MPNWAELSKSFHKFYYQKLLVIKSYKWIFAHKYLIIKLTFDNFVEIILRISFHSLYCQVFFTKIVKINESN